jgi:L-lactate dehydrogenase complex protein LldG
MQGKIYNKDSFLNHVAGTIGRERKTNVEKPVWKNAPQWDVLKDYSQDELVHVLKKQCGKIHTTFIEVSFEQLQRELRDVIHEFGGGPIVAWDDPRFEEYNISFGEFQDELYVWDPEKREENIKVATHANVGVTFSDITLAESGTVVLFSNKGKGRSVSLLPATYIAIIPKSTLVPRMTQAARIVEERVSRGEQVSSCVNFISGPSNSADIEMNLIVGVHGPIKATYIVVSDR